MVALKPQSRRCAAAIAALSSAALLSSMPASAASPVDSDETSITGDPSNAPEAAPTSSASLAADDLAALRTGNIEDFARFTPGLEIDTALGVSNPAIFIRGIGLKNYHADATGSVAVYQDGVNIDASAIQLGQLFDLEGIDVLRGPQGSVNGRNATAGALLLRSNLPSGEFDVSASLTYGNYDDREIEAAVDIPLVKDLLSMRVSGTAQWRDGYTRNQCAGWNPAAHGFPVVDEASNREFYDQLAPTAMPVALKRGTFGSVFQDYAYLDIDTVNYINQNGIAEGAISTGTARNPVQLAAPLTLPNGTVLPIGTLVGLQQNTFTRADVDGVCMVGPPGGILTPKGSAVSLNGLGDPGTWLARRVQPGLEEFAGLKSWTNNVDHWAARTVLLFEPLDNMEWMFNAHGQQNRGDSRHLQMLGARALQDGGFEERSVNDFNEQTASQNATAAGGEPIDEGWRNVKGVRDLFGSAPGQGGGNPYSGFYSSDGREIVDHWGINGRGRWDLGLVLVTLLYDYEWYDREIQDEGDANPQRIFPSVWQDSAWQTTEDLRVEHEGERYRATAGMYYLREQLDTTSTFPDVVAFFIQQTFDQTLTSWAPYVAGTVELVDEGTIDGIEQLELSAGFRYNVETREYSLSTAAAGTQAGAGAVLVPPGYAQHTWKKFTYDAQLSYTPFSNAYGALLSYLKYSHGFKGGRFNAGLTIRAGAPSQSIEPVQPEFVDALEFGIRTRWLDDRLMLDAAVFRYWCDDLQIFDITNEAGALPLGKLLNGDARVLGAEATLVVRPLPGLTIEGQVGWLDSEYKNFTVTKTIVPPRSNILTPTPFDYSGNRLVAAPEWTASLISSYEIPLFGWGTLVPEWDFSYRSKVYLDPQMLDPISQDGYWIHNARLAYRTPGEQIELAFWIANVFDEQYKLDTFDVTREFDTILEAWGVPRTYGVTLSLNW